jgi:hypothetical protein
MTDIDAGSFTHHRQNRHDQAVLSAEVRRLVRVLRAVQPHQRASRMWISQTERQRKGSFDWAVTEAIRDEKAREPSQNFLAAGHRGAERTKPSGPPSVARS